MTTTRYSGRWWRRAIAVALFMALVGPAVGGLIFPGPLYLPVLLTLVMGYGSESLSAVGVILLGGYAVGLVPAALAGLIMGVVTWRSGSISYWGTALAGVLGVLTFEAYLVADTWWREDPIVDLRHVLMILGPTSTAAAVVCRFLLARLRILPAHPL